MCAVPPAGEQEDAPPGLRGAHSPAWEAELRGASGLSLGLGHTSHRERRGGGQSRGQRSAASLHCCLRPGRGWGRGKGWGTDRQGEELTPYVGFCCSGKSEVAPFLACSLSPTPGQGTFLCGFWRRLLKGNQAKAEKQWLQRHARAQGAPLPQQRAVGRAGCLLSPLPTDTGLGQ